MATMTPSSPRLPSPPPAAEIQIGPKSPGLSTTASRQSQQMEQTLIDANAKRRIHPGTNAADMAAGPPLVPLSELDSAFQLQEHLAALHYYHTVSNTQPITRETAALLASAPPSIDRILWLYELCRFLVSQCNSLIVGFFLESPPCSAATCPEMRASEWQFLCAVHEQPKSCCAIDYCCHTLDWAANVVTNPKIFPSRFVALSGSDGSTGHDKNIAHKNLVNVFRRLHRIFAHAWFQHRGVFWSIEGQTGLYVFFKTVCDSYETLPAENYKLPPEAEGLESATVAAESMERGRNLVQTPIIKPPPDEENFPPAMRTNTRRHIRGSPSTGSAVTTVVEADEDDSSDVKNELGEMHISVPEIVEEEPEVAEVPVIVEHGVIDEPKPETELQYQPPFKVQKDAEEEPEKQDDAEPAVSDPKKRADLTPDSQDKGEAGTEEGTRNAAEVAAEDSQVEASEEEEDPATTEDAEPSKSEGGVEEEVVSTNGHNSSTEITEDAEEETKPAASEESTNSTEKEEEKASKPEEFPSAQAS